MPEDVVLKQFELSEQAALLSFLRIAYPDEPRKSDPKFWHWQFLENPYTKPDNIPLWIVKRGAEILGQVVAIPTEAKIGDEEKRALWIVDYILHADFRGQRLGKRLLEIPHQNCKTLMALGYNKNAEKPMRGLNWQLLGDINRYHILLFPGNASKEIRNLGPLRKIVDLAYAPFRPRLKPAAKGVGGLREVTTFDSLFDTLWKEARGQWICAIVRSARLLQWQFMQQPGKKFDVLGYYENDRLLGYVVLFFRKQERGIWPKAAISDLCYGPSNPESIIDELLKGALRLALERRAGSLVTDVLDPRVENRLRQFGFVKIKAAPPFAANVLESQELAYNLSNWFLTRADSDVSIFEDPNL